MGAEDSLVPSGSGAEGGSCVSRTAVLLFLGGKDGRLVPESDLTKASNADVARWLDELENPANQLISSGT